MLTKKRISIVAASLLTAAAVLTGCGGGGSSTTPTNVSSSSSAPVEPTIKKVVVSDGYVLNATVKCKNANGNDLTYFASTQNAGEYEADITTTGCPVLYAKNGYIDANNNGIVDSGEAKAPLMEAPGSYMNINPFTTLIKNGATPQEIARAFNLPENTNFDIAIPQARNDVRRAAVKLSIVLAYIQSQGTSATMRGALPSLPGMAASQESSSSSDASSSSNANSSQVLTMQTLIQAVKNNTLDDLDAMFPQDIVSFFNTIDTVNEPEQYDEMAREVLARYNGAYGAMSSSSSTSSSTESSSSAGGILPSIPSYQGGGETTGNNQGGSGISYSSSSTSSSAGNDMPPPPPSAESSSSSSSSSAGNDMPPLPPSAESSSSSSSSSSGGETPPPPPPAPAP